MYDKRVVRGPTYRAKPELAASITPLHLNQKPNTKAAVTIQSPIKQSASASSASAALLSASSALLGTASIVTQTDDYLEELTDEVFQQDNNTQTDASLAASSPSSSSLPLLSSPLFVPKPRGVDASTCIEGTELFDFETEVQAVLAVLVGKALDQALVEAREEEEMQRLETERQRFDRQRQLVLTEVQRLEAEHMRRVKEKERRFEQERDRLLAEQHAAAQHAAQQAAQAAHTALLLQQEKAAREARRDPVEEDVAAFMPWLQERVRDSLQQQQSGLQLVDALIAEGGRAVRESMRLEAERKEAERRAAEEAAKRQREEEEEVRRVKAEEERRAKEQAEAEEAARLAAKAEKERAETEAEGGDDGEDGGD